MTFASMLATLLLGLVMGICVQSPYILRVVAAALLTKADTIDTARAKRRERWQHHSRSLGVVAEED